MYSTANITSIKTPVQPGTVKKYVIYGAVLTFIRYPFYMRRHQDAKVEHFDVSNVIYHKFSHVAVSYTLNGENVNVMLEYRIQCITWSVKRLKL